MLRAEAGRRARDKTGCSEAVSASNCASGIADLFKDLRSNTETFKEWAYIPLEHYYKSPVAVKLTAKI